MDYQKSKNYGHRAGGLMSVIMCELGLDKKEFLNLLKSDGFENGLDESIETIYTQDEINEILEDHIK